MIDLTGWLENDVSDIVDYITSIEGCLAVNHEPAEENTFNRILCDLSQLVKESTGEYKTLVISSFSA